MDEVIGLIRELAGIVREIHENSAPDNFRSREILAQLKKLEARADGLLPQRPAGPGISPDRPQAEWDALVGIPKLRAVKSD